MRGSKDGFSVELDNLRESGKLFSAGADQIETVRNFQLGSAVNAARHSTGGGTENAFAEVAEGFEESFDVLVEHLAKIRDATDALGEAISAIAQRYKNQG